MRVVSLVCHPVCVIPSKRLLQGISFLDVKNHLMLSYVMNLTHIMSRKLSGKSICGSADIQRLVEIRTVRLLFVRHHRNSY